jgi:hypothetical protein
MYGNWVKEKERAIYRRARRVAIICFAVSVRPSVRLQQLRSSWKDFCEIKTEIK